MLMFGFKMRWQQGLKNYINFFVENEQNMGFKECIFAKKNYQIFVLGQFDVTYVIFKDKSM